METLYFQQLHLQVVEVVVDLIEHQTQVVLVADKVQIMEADKQQVQQVTHHQ